MVAKLASPIPIGSIRLNLAKIHMVAKHPIFSKAKDLSLNLAKIHMVAKHGGDEEVEQKGLNLAKIHMVAKLYLSVDIKKNMS